jgi:hypothetical protein
MDWLISDHLGTPTDKHATIGEPYIENIRGLNLEVVKLTTVQVTKLPL